MPVACHMDTVGLRSSGRMGRLSAPTRPTIRGSQPLLPLRKPLHNVSKRQLLVRAQPSENKKANKTPDEDPNPFFEPLVRSFILGVGAGALVEASHVTLQITGMAVNLGYQQLVDALPSLVDDLAPMFAVDHVAAVGSWMAFYLIEALAIVSIIDRYPNDMESANKAIRKMVTLPQRMLPLKLRFAKVLLQATNRMRGPAVAAASSALSSPRRSLSRSPSTKDMTTNAFVDGSSNSALLEPPSVVKDSPEIARLFPETLPEATPSPAAAPAPVKPKAVRTGLRPGQVDPKTDDFLGNRQARKKELKERRGYLQNFWYAAALSENVKDKPVRVEILSTQVVLFRDPQGQVHCMTDACVHRGAPLSEGWTANVNGHDCVVCPYHGWAFDTEGKLRDAPSEEDTGKWPKRSLVKTYPVKEQGGFIWMFYGSKDLPEDERPPIPHCPELDDPEWTPTYGEIEFECGHWGVFENAIDMAHIHYLHSQTFGNQEQPKIHDMNVSRDAYGVNGTFKIHNKPVNAAWEWTKTPIVPVTAKALLPSSSMITIQLGSGVSMITFVNTVPINATKSVNRFCLVRNFAQWDGLNMFAFNAMMQILGEDKVMVEKLRPELVPQEVSLVADMPQIEFRKLRKEYADMGYVVDPEDAALEGTEVQVDM